MANPLTPGYIHLSTQSSIVNYFLMSNFDWGYPNTVWFGNGRIKDLPKACKVLDIKNHIIIEKSSRTTIS